MTAQSATKATIPVGSDGWNPVVHIKQVSETTRSIIPVADATERGNLASTFPGGTLPIPTIISRADLGYRFERWDGAVWKPVDSHVVSPGISGLPIIQASEVAVTIGASSVGIINFPQAFPNAVRVCTITDSTAAANGIVVKYRSDLSSKTQAKFTAFDNTTGNGIANGIVMYVNYIAIGY